MSNDKMREALDALENMALHCNSATGDARDRYQRGYRTIKSALTQQPESEHWAVKNPGAADQFRCEAKAVREQLGFDRDADDISPAELQESIKKLQSPQPSAQVPEGWVLDFVRKVERLANEAKNASKEIPQLLSLCLSARSILADPRATTEQLAPSVAEKREWISLRERLPSESDADTEGLVWVWVPGDKRAYLAIWDNIDWDNEEFSHWKPTGISTPESPIEGDK